MIKPETKLAIKEMRKHEMSIKEICKTLEISRNTVRRVIRDKHNGVNPKTSKYQDHIPIIRELYPVCKKNAVRLKEVLEEKYKISIPYPSLVWLVRKEGLNKSSKKQSGSYSFAPGVEAQHDTSPYKIKLGEKKITVQCASLILAHSRRLYIQFYPRYTRFEARIFLIEALKYMDGSCTRCTIDNTSVLVAYGAGPNAEITPQIRQLGKMFDMKFIPHNVGHPDRKARVERAFYYVEKNFLAARTFADWDDLNKKALAWCENVANQKPKRSLGMSPEQAYIMEKPSLIPLPAYIPAVYMTVYRVVDIQGYVHLDTNRYSVPYKLVGEKVEVQKHKDHVLIYHANKKIAEHKREMKKKDSRVTLPAHHAPYLKQKSNTSSSMEEKMLKGENQILDSYVAELKKRSHGRGVARFRKLLGIKRTYPEDAFMAGIRQAGKYGLYDLTRLEKIIISFIAGEFFDL